MKLIRYLLILYALFLILIAPALHVAGSLTGRTLINLNAYFWAAAIFVAVVLLYLAKSKKG